MKKQLFILSLFITGTFISHAQEKCDTLKLKVINSEYIINLLSDPVRMGKLDGAVINMDSFPVIYPGPNICNVSKDTFRDDGRYRILSSACAYTDTGEIQCFGNTRYYYFHRNILPNDTFGMGVNIEFDFPDMIDYIKKEKGIDFAQITHWKMINVVIYTDKDGYYTDSILTLGDDTATFYVIKTPLGIQETENEQSTISVFPNPAQSQFTITGAEDATIRLYNMQGQQILQTAGKGDNTVIYTENLPTGVYVLKMEKANAVHTRKVQVVR